MGNLTLKKKYKYFVVSDIHGFYDEFISSLNEKGFDSKNPEHYLISLGDAFDRGPKNLEVLKFLNNLERKILIRGNHEDLYQQLIDRKGSPLPNDITNGTIDTFLQIQNLTSDDLSDIIDEKKEFPKLNPEWLKYISNCINYYETKHYIFIHGWIPINKDETYNKKWRKASKDDWDKARWISGIDMSKKKVFCP
jgi:serine/threonine protein phosphatase 1